jgi:hypothetical protein
LELQVAKAPDANDRSAEATFEAFLGVWERCAARNDGFETRAYRLLGNDVELRVAGAELVPCLTRAFAHLSPGSGDSGLVVHAWEGRADGEDALRPTWGLEDYRERGKIRALTDQRFQTHFPPGAEVLVMLDLALGRAILWARDPAKLSQHELAAPLRVILHGWLSSRGVELVHGGAVGASDSCVLIAGRSGSGKSWSSLAAAAAGLGILGDDYCAVRPGSPPRVASVYSSAKTVPEALDHLPFLRGMVSNPVRGEGEKAVYFLHEHIPERLLLEADLRAILVPRQGLAVSTRLREASAADALRALAPTTIVLHPGAGQATLASLARVTQAVPCYFLDLGGDLDTIAPAIAPLLERGGAPSP